LRVSMFVNKETTYLLTYLLRLQWFGRVKRMDNSRLPAKTLETMATGTRTRGRLKKRWTENVKEDIQKISSNIRQAVECAKDRKQ